MPDGLFWVMLSLMRHGDDINFGPSAPSTDDPDSVGNQRKSLSGKRDREREEIEFDGLTRREAIMIAGFFGLVVGLIIAVLITKTWLNLTGQYDIISGYIIITLTFIIISGILAKYRYGKRWRKVSLEKGKITLYSLDQTIEIQTEDMSAVVSITGLSLSGGEMIVWGKTALYSDKQKYYLKPGSPQLNQQLFDRIMALCPQAVGIPFKQPVIFPALLDQADRPQIQSCRNRVISILNKNTRRGFVKALLYLIAGILCIGIGWLIGQHQLDSKKDLGEAIGQIIVLGIIVTIAGLISITVLLKEHAFHQRQVFDLKNWRLIDY